MTQELFLVCHVGKCVIALPATQIEAVATCGDIVPVPHSPHSVAGLVAVRSRLLTLIDLALLAGECAGSPVDSRLMIITSVDGHCYGLQIDAVDDVVELASLRDPPANLAPGWHSLTSRICDHLGRVILIIQPADVIAAITRPLQKVA